MVKLCPDFSQDEVNKYIYLISDGSGKHMTMAFMQPLEKPEQRELPFRRLAR